jgi:hypothetical protein
VHAFCGKSPTFMPYYRISFHSDAIQGISAASLHACIG